MEKLIVMLPEDRSYAGTLRLEDEEGAVVAGPFAVCGRADEGAARLNGNPSRNPLLPFGDTPLGRYRIEGILPSGAGTQRPADRYGPHGVIVLTPTAGDAALADANGRFHLLIQGGPAGPGRRLRPTNGSLRLGNREQKQLIDILRDRRGIVCEFVPLPAAAATRPVALDTPCGEGDPPAGVVAAIASPRFPSNGLRSTFAPPNFSLMSEGGGGGGDSGGGYPDADSTAADLTSAAKTLTTDPTLTQEYKPAPNGQTRCSEFVRDFAQKVVGSDKVPELAGQAADQVDRLSKSKNWDELPFSKNPQQALNDAQAAQNAGQLVVYGWVNPDPPTKPPYNSGHVAVGIPSSQPMPDSGNWSLKVPYIAQAGGSGAQQTTLNYGFGADKKSGLRIFVMKK